jgi:hypothetical protein
LPSKQKTAFVTEDEKSTALDGLKYKISCHEKSHPGPETDQSQRSVVEFSVQADFLMTINSVFEAVSAVEASSSTRASPGILGVVGGFIPWAVDSLKPILPYFSILDGP